MDLALNNLQMLACHNTQPTNNIKRVQTAKDKYHIELFVSEYLEQFNCVPTLEIIVGQ